MDQAATSAAAIAAAAGHLLWAEPEWVQACVARGWEWPRIMWRRAASQVGAWYDERKSDAAIKLFPKFFRLTDDRFAGKPFRLALWQEAIVRLMVGWRIPTEVRDDEQSEPRIEHVRLYRRLLLWVPRKNGKSEFLAALALMFFVLDGVVGGQGFAFARDEKQARIVFDKMKAMIAMSPALSNVAKPFKKSIWLPKIRAMFELLSGKPEGKHGRSPTVIVGDEMHEWDTADLAATLRQGTGARLQPIELYASTAGTKSNPTGWQLWEESVAILDGRIDDPTSLVVIFAIDADEDWADEANWPRANPSLGISPTIQSLRIEAAKAVDNPRAEAHFRCYHLNQWIDSVVRWLNIKKWDACTADKTSWKASIENSGLRGRRCFVTLDVSSTQDITALLALFPPDEGEEKWRLACRFWVPEETAVRRTRQDRVSYEKWLQICALEKTPGDYVDQNFVKRGVLEWLGEFDVQLIGVDPWNARKLMSDLQSEGVDPDMFVELRQGHQTLGEATKFFEGLVTSGKLDHGGHPVLRWMAGNASVRFDENLNFVPAKKRSADKIDGIVAGVMACALAIDGTDSVDVDAFISSPVMVGV